MREALALADKAAAAGEVPVGAVVVYGDTVIGRGWNRPIRDCDPTAHAEILALREAATHLGAYRLPDTKLYVTLEPCPMCVGAMIHARLTHVIFGAGDPKTGACGGAMDLPADPSHNHQLEITSGIHGDTASEKLRSFFRERRP